MLTIQGALDMAVRHHMAGQLSDAEALYRQILAVEPRHPDALHLLGLVAHQTGRNEDAADLIGRCLAIKPNFPEARSNLGNALQALGRLADAVNQYKRALSAKPDFVDARYNLGTALARLGRTEQAITSFRKVLAIAPDHAQAQLNLGNGLLALGRRDEAAACYRKALAAKPDLREAHGNLAKVLTDMGRPDEALACCHRALALGPDAPDTLNNLGTALLALRRTDEAVAAFRQALAVAPDYPEAHSNLGNALREQGNPADALPCYERAIALRPDYVEALNNLGTALKDLDRWDDAGACFEKAIALRPDYPEALNGLALVVFHRGDHRRAMDLIRRVLALRPDMAHAHNNLGTFNKDLENTAEAIRNFDRALALDPSCPDAHVNRSYCNFVSGQLTAAWTDYEWRWKQAATWAKRPFPQPWWTGEPLGDRTLLVWGEQGLADEILAASMFGDLARAGGRIIHECDPRLVPLLARSFPALSVVPRRTPPVAETAAADVQISAFSLALHYRLRREDFPRHDGYLIPDPARVARWSAWLDTLGPGLKVGISWRGRLIRDGRSNHFPPLDHQAVILDTPGIVFVNLQYDGFTDDIEALHRRTGVTIHSPLGIDLTNDLDEVAALMAGLDAVVGPATAVGDLAGAVGRPTWMYAHHPIENEKELCGLDHLPWCPAIRAQTVGLDRNWTPALARISAELRAFAASRT